MCFFVYKNPLEGISVFNLLACGTHDICMNTSFLFLGSEGDRKEGMGTKSEVIDSHRSLMHALPAKWGLRRRFANSHGLV